MNLERDTARDLNVPRRAHASIPFSKVRACNIGVECASAQSTGLNKGSDVIEVVFIENVKCISAQLERKPLVDVNRLLQADVEISIARLPEILNPWPLACIEVKASGRFECGNV